MKQQERGEQEEQSLREVWSKRIKAETHISPEPTSELGKLCVLALDPSGPWFCFSLFLLRQESNLQNLDELSGTVSFLILSCRSVDKQLHSLIICI